MRNPLIKKNFDKIAQKSLGRQIFAQCACDRRKAGKTQYFVIDKSV